MKSMPVTILSKSTNIERRHMPAHETTVEATFGRSDAPIRPSQYRSSQAALAKHLNVKPTEMPPKIRPSQDKRPPAQPKRSYETDIENIERKLDTLRDAHTALVQRFEQLTDVLVNLLEAEEL